MTYDRQRARSPSRRRDGAGRRSTANTGSRADADGANLAARLQRRHGNRAVSRLCRRDCSRPSLEVSDPSDPAEREAERVAERVMRASPPSISSGAGSDDGRSTDGRPIREVHQGAIQRMCARCRRRHERGKPLDCEECEAELARTERSAGPEAVSGPTAAQIRSVRGGSPLPDDTRSFFESRFGADFSAVRVHTGSRADEAARSVNATAFTLGTDVVFRAGAYRPGTEGGKRLLAHELTHVVQQGAAGRSLRGTRDSAAPSPAGEPVRRSASATVQRSVDAVDSLSELEGHGDRAELLHLPLQLLSMLDADVEPPADNSAAVADYDGPEIRFDPSWEDVGRSLEVAYPGWISTTTQCPCTESEVAGSDLVAGGGWDATGPHSGWFHAGAVRDYRTAPSETVPGTAHANQCCYDVEGDLITGGPGAGTPDVWDARGQNALHLLVDATPWSHLGWQTYNEYWVPDERAQRACETNEPQGSHLSAITVHSVVNVAHMAYEQALGVDVYYDLLADAEDVAYYAGLGVFSEVETLYGVDATTALEYVFDLIDADAKRLAASVIDVAVRSFIDSLLSEIEPLLSSAEAFSREYGLAVRTYRDNRGTINGRLGDLLGFDVEDLVRSRGWSTEKSAMGTTEGLYGNVLAGVAGFAYHSGAFDALASMRAQLERAILRFIEIHTRIPVRLLLEQFE